MITPDDNAKKNYERVKRWREKNRALVNLKQRNYRREKKNLPVPVLAGSQMVAERRPNAERNSGEARESTNTTGTERSLTDSRGGHPFYEKTKNENGICKDERETLRSIREDRSKTKAKEPKEMESNSKESGSSSIKDSSAKRSDYKTGCLSEMPKIDPIKESSRSSHELLGTADSGVDLSRVPSGGTSTIGGGQKDLSGGELGEGKPTGTSNHPSDEGQVSPPAQTFKDETLERLRGLIKVEEEKPRVEAPVAVKRVYRSETGMVITKEQWEEREAEKNKARSKGFEIDEYSQT